MRIKLLDMILKSTGMTESELIEKNKKDKEAHDLFIHNKWGSWKQDNDIKLKRELLAQEVVKALSSQGEEMIIRPIKTQLGKVISWSSSRYNEYKKSDVVDYILSALTSPKSDNEKSHEYVTGCFSAGSTGDAGGKNRGSNFAVKNLSGGTYQLFRVDGLPYLIVGYANVIKFHGYKYPVSIEVDYNLLEKYQEYKKDVGLY